MKKLITLTILTLTANSFACEITLAKKTIKAKTSYIDGISVSKKIQDALSSQCKLNYKVLSKEQVKAMTIQSLQNRLKKLQAPN